jgi:hypothetical protein
VPARVEENHIENALGTNRCPVLTLGQCWPRNHLENALGAKRHAVDASVGAHHTALELVFPVRPLVKLGAALKNRNSARTLAFALARHHSHHSATALGYPVHSAWCGGFDEDLQS